MIDFSDQLERLLVNKKAYEESDSITRNLFMIQEEEMAEIAEIIWKETGGQAVGFCYGGFTFLLKSKREMTHMAKPFRITPLYEGNDGS